MVLKGLKGRPSAGLTASPKDEKGLTLCTQHIASLEAVDEAVPATDCKQTKFEQHLYVVAASGTVPSSYLIVNK
jgi:hypothetical protein